MDILINKIDSKHDTLADKTTKIESNLTYTKEELTELFNSLERSEKELNVRINAIEKLLTDSIKSVDVELTKKIKLVEDSTGSILQTKWMGMGMIAFATWALSNIESLKKLFGAS
jgi:hypothetical protein